MALSAEVLAAITALRKELEDLVHANTRKIYKYKYGEKELTTGENTVSFTVDADTAYASADDYEIRIHEALDEDDIDMKASLLITEKTTAGFKVDSLRNGSLKWEAFLKTPDFNYWT